jgi:hypothetical protein
MTSPAKPRLQFGLMKLFWLMTLLASTAALFAWVKPYFAIGVDPTLTALPLLGLVLGLFAIALVRLTT